MSETFALVRGLVVSGAVRVSEHGYDELAEDGISVAEILSAVSTGTVVEDYPDYPKGRSVLVRQVDGLGRAIHAVWGIPKGFESPAVLVTAYSRIRRVGTNASWSGESDIQAQDEIHSRGAVRCRGRS